METIDNLNSIKEIEITLNPEDLFKYKSIAVVFKLCGAQNNGILSFLRSEERETVETIIKNRDITQAKLTRILNFSKPKLWRLIKDLESRGVVERKRYGKTYILRCKIF